MFWGNTLESSYWISVYLIAEKCVPGITDFILEWLLKLLGTKELQEMLVNNQTVFIVILKHLENSSILMSQVSNWMKLWFKIHPTV